MKFIKLTSKKETYFINCDKINNISTDGSNTYVVFSGGNYVIVDQTPEEILELIKKEEDK